MAQGVDVFWGNGDIDFAPYDFVVLQAYDGATGRAADTHGGWFSRNANAVVAQGKVLMAYLWLSTNRPVADQIRDYLGQTAGFPVKFHWTDIEEPGVGAALNDEALQRLPANSGTYSNGGQYPGGRADNQAWWAAGYPNVSGARRAFQIHQYADKPHDTNIITDSAWYAGVVDGSVSAPAPVDLTAIFAWGQLQDQKKKGSLVGISLVPCAGIQYIFSTRKDGGVNFWGPYGRADLLPFLGVHEVIDPQAPIPWDVQGTAFTVLLETQTPGRILKVSFGGGKDWSAVIL